MDTSTPSYWILSLSQPSPISLSKAKVVCLCSCLCLCLYRSCSVRFRFFPCKSSRQNRQVPVVRPRSLLPVDKTLTALVPYHSHDTYFSPHLPLQLFSDLPHLLSSLLSSLPLPRTSSLPYSPLFCLVLCSLHRTCDSSP